MRLRKRKTSFQHIIFGGPGLREPMCMSATDGTQCTGTGTSVAALALASRLATKVMSALATASWSEMVLRQATIVLKSLRRIGWTAAECVRSTKPWMDW